LLISGEPGAFCSAVYSFEEMPPTNSVGSYDG